MPNCNAPIVKPTYTFSEQCISSDRMKKLKDQTVYTDVKIAGSIPNIYATYTSKYSIKNGFINCISN
jgi:hypothetical protein